MENMWHVHLFGLDLRKPYVQALYIFSVACFAMGALWLFYPTEEASWLIGASGILLFTIVNTVNSLFRHRWLRYALISFSWFVAITVLLFLLSGIMSEKGFAGPNVYHSIFALFLVFFIMANMIAGLIRQLISFLEDIDN